jgi:hypothetical protein
MQGRCELRRQATTSAIDKIPRDIPLSRIAFSLAIAGKSGPCDRRRTAFSHRLYMSLGCCALTGTTTELPGERMVLLFL